MAQHEPDGMEKLNTVPKAVEHLVILGHPSNKSFNAAIARRYIETVEANYHVAVLRDLYALRFDPCLKEEERLASGDRPLPADVSVELDLIERCDVITFVYPLWFGVPPAIIKGYLDRVFGAAFRVSDLKSDQRTLFAGKRLAVLSTSAATMPWLDSQGMWMSLRQSFETYLKTVFNFSECSHYHAASIVDDLSHAETDRILFEVTEFTRNLCANAAKSKRGS